MTSEVELLRVCCRRPSLKNSPSKSVFYASFSTLLLLHQNTYCVQLCKQSSPGRGCRSLQLEFMHAVWMENRRREVKSEIEPENKFYWCLPFAINANCISTLNYDTLHWPSKKEFYCLIALQFLRVRFKAVEGDKEDFVQLFHKIQFRKIAFDFNAWMSSSILQHNLMFYSWNTA